MAAEGMQFPWRWNGGTISLNLGVIWKMSAEVRTVLLTTLLATVFGAAGWLITHTVDRVVSVPTVQYELDTSRHADGQIVVTVRNLSRDHRFADLAFILRLPAGSSGKFTAATVEPIPPAYANRESPPSAEGSSASYEKIGLHPETSIKLKADYNGKTVPTFHIDQSGEAVRLLEKGLLTGAIRNEIEILSGLFLAWCAIVIFAFSTLTKGANGDDE
jgi:hypothetical protein